MRNLRISLARQLIRLGHLVQSLAVVVMRPDDLIEFGRQTYARPQSVASWSQAELVGQGLYENELALIQRSPVQTGKLLLLGLGGGREAIPFAKQGFQVTGVDFVPGMVEHAMANAAQSGVQIEGLVQEISRLRLPAAAVDLVWLSSRMYSCIPTRRRRAAMLAEVAQALRPDGCFVCQFDWSTRPLSSPRSLLLYRLFSLVTLGYTKYEPGDRLWANIEFVHSFSDEAILRREFAEGGFEVLYLYLPEAGYGGAILRKRPSTEVSSPSGGA